MSKVQFCVTCRYPVGRFQLAFEEARRRYFAASKKSLTVLTETTVEPDETSGSLEAIFEQFGIEQYCCRRTLTSSIDFNKFAIPSDQFH